MFRLSASQDVRGVNTITIALLLSPALGCSWHVLQRVASKLPSPLCSPQSVKWAGRLVCALIAISVLQDVLLTTLFYWATVNQLPSLCLQSSVEQDWDLGLLSPALSWGQGFVALRLLWSLTNDVLAETNPRAIAAPAWTQSVGSSSWLFHKQGFQSQPQFTERGTCTCLI